MSLRVLPMGPAAALIEEPPGNPASWAQGIRRLGLGGVVDIVPAANTVLLRCADEPSMRAALARLPDVTADAGDDTDARTIVIQVRYDGIDLEHVASATELTVDEVVTAHSGAEYRVAFCGFAPGFGYLTGLPSRLHLPRRPSPRTRVPAGSVAIAAEYAAVYPRESPGGWHLIGHTDHVMFALDQDPPATLSPGAVVRFTASS